jgi:hypothetical protein
VRIATMIISLILMLVVGAQSCAVRLGDAALQTKAAEQGGPIGLFTAFLFLIGGAFALAFRPDEWALSQSLRGLRSGC